MPGLGSNKVINRGNIESWEWKIFGVIILCIVIIIGFIWYSYKLSDTHLDKFTTYKELTDELNENRENINKIIALQNQKIIDVDPNVSAYIQSDKIFPHELENRLNTNFDIRFSQKLQDVDLEDLQTQLGTLKQKMSKLPPVPTNYMLKNLSGSAFEMLGTPNDFSLKINPSEGKCLAFSTYGLNNIDKSTGEYKSAKSMQCDIGGGDKSQRFKLTEITNNQDFNNLVGNLNSVPDYYSLNNYPFMVAQPVDGTLRADGMINECITFDNSGLSVEPCAGKEEQRWHTYN